MSQTQKNQTVLQLVLMHTHGFIEILPSLPFHTRNCHTQLTLHHHNQSTNQPTTKAPQHSTHTEISDILWLFFWKHIRSYLAWILVKKKDQHQHQHKTADDSRIIVLFVLLVLTVLCACSLIISFQKVLCIVKKKEKNGANKKIEIDERNKNKRMKKVRRKWMK
jgi:hypothetical protein